MYKKMGEDGKGKEKNEENWKIRKMTLYPPTSWKFFLLRPALTLSITITITLTTIPYKYTRNITSGHNKLSKQMVLNDYM